MLLHQSRFYFTLYKQKYHSRMFGFIIIVNKDEGIQVLTFRALPVRQSESDESLKPKAGNVNTGIPLRWTNHLINSVD